MRSDFLSAVHKCLQAPQPEGLLCTGRHQHHLPMSRMCMISLISPSLHSHGMCASRMAIYSEYTPALPLTGYGCVALIVSLHHRHLRSLVLYSHHRCCLHNCTHVHGLNRLSMTITAAITTPSYLAFGLMLGYITSSLHPAQP